MEIHKKFAIPAACLVFSVLGVPMGIRAHRGGRWGAFVALLPIVLFYYVALTLGENLGDSGRIPPWLGMWGPNIVVGAVAVYLLRANLKERPIPVVVLIQRWFWAAVAWGQRLGGADRPAAAPAGARPPPPRRGRGAGSGGSSGATRSTSSTGTSAWSSSRSSSTASSSRASS